MLLSSLSNQLASNLKYQMPDTQMLLPFLKTMQPPVNLTFDFYQGSYNCEIIEGLVSKEDKLAMATVKVFMYLV